MIKIQLLNRVWTNYLRKLKDIILKVNRNFKVDISIGSILFSIKQISFIKVVKLSMQLGKKST